MALPYTLLKLIIIATVGSAQNNYYYEPSTTSHTPAFWTATTRLVDVYTESPYTWYEGKVTTDAFLTTRTIKNSVTPTVAATFTTTILQGHEDVELVYLYYPTGAVAEADLLPESLSVNGLTPTTSLTTTTMTVYDYYMPVTMTAPSSCPTIFTVTSVASVDIPRAARALVTPTSTVAGATVSDRYGDTTVSETWYLSSGAAPFPTMDDYNYYAYIESCYTPPLPYKTASPTPSSTTGGGLYYDPNDSSSSPGNSDSSGGYECYWGPTGCLSTEEIIIIVCSIVGGFFLLGFLESWFWFRRLMHGRRAMRLGTVCWILTTLIVVCVTSIQDKRTKEDQIVLAEKWKEMKAGAKFKAWMKYAFRHRYPEEFLGQFSRMTVGIVPPGEPLPVPPAMKQPPLGVVPGSQVFYYGPNGQPVPLQGYMVPAGQHAGYYGGEMPKQAIVIGTVPLFPRHSQPVHSSSRGAFKMTGALPPPTVSGSIPPSEAPLPPLPPRSTPSAPPQEPVESNMSIQAPTSAPPVPPVAKSVAPPEDTEEAAQTTAERETCSNAVTDSTSQILAVPQNPAAVPHEVSPNPTPGVQIAPQVHPVDLSDPSAINAIGNTERPSDPPSPKCEPDKESLYN
ncbi:predicted protein [Plenodomus lingam JN3]|uniref:Predicted protein n=1 Tax=Leptosphaeria maculans (strain JN3 / isolate v23.1.3 / race Av1-4-5-6-7-8) TaxID=985895 RepID=E5ADY9_LEPMJ|nr:predicted protein [Plenodomus lingam JN3]CBY01428.1 predicted protein [Plenodomus lingam JN3]